MILQEIPETMVESIWPEAENYLGAAISSQQKEEHLLTLKGRCMTGLSQLWRVVDKNKATLAFATTTIYTANGISKTLQIDTATANNFAVLLKHFDEFESWAHTKDIDFIEVVGRKGWERVLKSLGFTHNFTSVSKPIFKELH